MSNLKTELKTFENKLSEMLNDQGKFALIQGNDLVGIYSAYDDALKIGYDKFGVDTQFLVKKIMQTEEIHYVNRGYCVECPA